MIMSLNSMKNNAQDQRKKAIEPWQYKKGQTGNPGGRPKGSKSLKTYIKERFDRMSDDEREEFLEGLPKEVVWKMAEGNPANNTDLTTLGRPIIQIAEEIAKKNDIN